MRRVVIVIVATIGGLGLIASFHTTPGVAVRGATHARTALPPPTTGAPPGGGGTSTPPASQPTPGSAAPPPATSPPASRTIVGPVESNQYGDVQVEAVIRNGQLADVEALELPSDRSRSREINSIAGPDLRQEALQAGSANIDIISGATYTSISYAQSLQAALDQVRS